MLVFTDGFVFSQNEFPSANFARIPSIVGFFPLASGTPINRNVM